LGDVYERGRKMRSLKANSKGRGELGEVGTKGFKRDRKNDGKEYKIGGMRLIRQDTELRYIDVRILLFILVRAIGVKVRTEKLAK
jgi:hypothetical protein